MGVVTVHNLSRNNIQAFDLKVCDSFFSRFKGLMLVKSIPPTSGILIDENYDGKANVSIHMFFMKLDIAVVWVNQNLRVVDLVLARKWHPIYVPTNSARYVLELHPDRLKDFSAGDQLRFIYE
jgi:uncharacterized membrane protein (UPF0127 family)